MSLHPMGWDNFGLPAEQYAMDTGMTQLTLQQHANFKRQINALEFSYDWDREVSTTGQATISGLSGSLPSFEGLAYETEVPVNWVEELGTAIANSPSHSGTSDVESYLLMQTDAPMDAQNYGLC